MKHISIFVLAFLAHGSLAEENRAGPDIRLIGLSADYGTGVVSQTYQPDIWGERFGLGAAMTLGISDGNPIFLEFGRSVLNGDTQSRTTHFLADGTPFVFATRTSPNGNVSLNSSADDTGAYASSIVSLTVAGGGDTIINSFTTSPPGGQASVWAYSTTDTGGLFTSVVTDGTGGVASAVGMIFDETGAAMMAEGTAGQIPVTTTRRDDVILTDGTIRLSTAISLDDGWNVFPRGGLMRRSLKRSTVFTQTIDVDDGFAVDAPTPEISIVQNADLRVDMTGVSVGAGFSRQLSDKWRFSLGADVGVLQGRSRYSLNELVQFDAYDTQIIDGPHEKDRQIVQMGRVAIGLSRQLTQGGVLSLSLHSDIMRGVPYLERVALGDSTPALPDGENDTSLDALGEVNHNFQLKYGDLRNSGLSLALVWLF